MLELVGLVHEVLLEGLGAYILEADHAVLLRHRVLGGGEVHVQLGLPVEDRLGELGERSLLRMVDAPHLLQQAPPADAAALVGQ